MRKEIARDLRTIFDATEIQEAERLVKLTAKKYLKTAPKLSQWIESDVPEGLAVLQLPHSQRRRLRTSNMLERLSQEIKRRTRVATLFPMKIHCSDWSAPCSSKSARSGRPARSISSRRTRRQTNREAARRGVQRGANERPLICVNATTKAAKPLRLIPQHATQKGSPKLNTTKRNLTEEMLLGHSWRRFNQASYQVLRRPFAIESKKGRTGFKTLPRERQATSDFDRAMNHKTNFSGIGCASWLHQSDGRVLSRYSLAIWLHHPLLSCSSEGGS